MKLHLSLALAVSLSAVACGGATIPPPSHAKLESSQDEVSRYRGALAQIKANHNAKSAASDITRAEEWLDTAKQISADNGSAARLRLYLDAVHAQLVMVQSHFAREEARKSAGMKDKDADHASESEGDDESIHAPNHTQAARGAAHSDRNDSNGDDL